ncbi:aldehyde dehydrogenase family protein [Lacisediminihabitans sp.]|uniref:aldehyde dehydrogenase family protein n=1 Tax=Lacisediminihabitans sp. TaxID=2787631 RepID=UPI00374CE5F2
MTLPLADVGEDPSFDPATGERTGGVAHSTPEEVARVLDLAERAAPRLSAASPVARETWVAAAADAVLAASAELVDLARAETGLGPDRLEGELARMAASARFYAAAAVEGSYLGVSRDDLPGGSSLVRWNIPVGVVAVFGASNFPFGFGIFGHDVASALAAGCPVVVKAHPAHPRLSVRLGAIVRGALRDASAPDGCFDVVVGFDSGLRLVDSPVVRAVAFTGSQRGGMALVERAARRGVPVFAEMGTVNPVLVTPAAASDRGAIARGFVDSFTLGAGQFCTKPGLILVPAGHGFVDSIAEAVSRVQAAPLLTAAIAAAYEGGVSQLVAASEGAPATGVTEPLPGFSAAARAIPVALDRLTPGSRLLEECFGPVALVAEYDDLESALAALDRLQPSLAASVFTGEDDADAADAIARLTGRVGRVAVNSWPTGVATTWSQQHGGPWPATSRPEATSVGAGALSRFVRPVSLQNASTDQLPAPLRPENPWKLPRRLNGRPTLPH